MNKANPTGERFLFCFTPTSPAISGPCGCSLIIGSQVVAIIFIACTLNPLFTVFQYKGFWDILYYGIVFGLYLFAGVSTFYSTYTYTYEYVHTANFIYNILFIINVFDNVIMTAFILRGYIFPFGFEIPGLTQVMYYVAAAYIASVSVILLIHMYMIWIVFSFMVHIKNNRKALVQGDIYKDYQDYEIGVEMSNRT
jgi:hypothetical protein